jgi:hypothetical protein
VKKVSERSVNCVEKLHKPPSFYARKGEIKSFCYSKQLIILLVYKEVYFNTNKLDLTLLFLAFVFLCCRSLMMCFKNKGASKIGRRVHDK